MFIGWRAMRAHERMAESAELMARNFVRQNPS
jgi:hypothetical protein